jgi:hypothetical protein
MIHSWKKYEMIKHGSKDEIRVIGFGKRYIGTEIGIQEIVL